MASILQPQVSAPHPDDNVDARTGPLPRELRGFQHYHAGETLLVCGCGSSLAEVVAPERFVTIGVNDVGRLFQPDYLVVLNPLQQFQHDRARYVEESRARAVFTQLQLPIAHPHIVRFRLGTMGGVTFDNPDVLHYTRNSPYLALCLAVHMGAKRVGLIGVDFTAHHFFGQTGRHPLAGLLTQIEREYRQLAESCERMGVEVVNLSRQSRVTAFPKMSPADFASTSMLDSREDARARGRKVFFVNYKFLSCGEVFTDGLDHAAADLKVEHAAAHWDDPRLEQKVEDFSPELLFVVHGRRFAQRWGRTFKAYKSAVWLTDEPYEVDDTARYSGLFDHVFVNDPSTLERHPRAHYLPTCYDPRRHFYSVSGERKHLAGFVGGHNTQREEFLEELTRRGLLSYVIGGPWLRPAVRSLCLSGNIPATETADLYRETKIVLNIFRITHHYNRAGVPATSLNPRVYEAAQCGALVVSERRAELAELCPEMPAFETKDELLKIVEGFAADPASFERVRRACVRRLAAHTYARRLSTVLSVALERGEECAPRSLISFATDATTTTQPSQTHPPMLRALTMTTTPQPSARVQVEPLPETLAAQWQHHGGVTRVGADGSIVMCKAADDGAGTEQGLAGKISYGNVALSFEVLLEHGACFIAKIHQQSATDQLTNSYHLFCHGARSYVARHNHVLQSVAMPRATWAAVKLVYQDKAVTLYVNGQLRCRAVDVTLAEGYCFLGLKGGTVHLRNITVEAAAPEESGPRAVPAHRILYDARPENNPRLSIITTVYDRARCLENCLRTVRALHFQDFEQIVVADSPPPPVLAQLQAVCEAHGPTHGRLLFANLNQRYNDWGITPSAAGLHLARGKYVCFLSDDNGYMPGHAGPLIEALDNDHELGFVYSSCLYDGRVTLQYAPPRYGRIDLGQPFFRKELFDIHLNGTLPFTELAWDWRLIQTLMRKGVRWRHIDRPTFIFRLAKYPHLIPAEG